MLRSPLRLDEPHQPQLVKHMSVPYDWGAGDDPYSCGCRGPVCKCFQGQNLVRISRFMIDNDDLSVLRVPDGDFAQHMENAVAVCD